MVPLYVKREQLREELGLRACRTSQLERVSVHYRNCGLRDKRAVSVTLAE
jgi:hypothetical protein